MNLVPIKQNGRTLPQESASTSILSKLGFKNTGSVTHPDDGEVWDWELI